MSTAIILLGRYGDIINALPIARHICDVHEKPAWVVSKQYQSVLMGCDYLTTDAVHFSIHKTNHAVDYASGKYSHILNATAWGKHWKGRRDTSFNYLSWEHVGYGGQFFDVKKFPLVFDNRDAGRERFLVQHHVRSDKPIILTCLRCSKSSPFGHASAMQAIIERKWGNVCQIVDLCGVKAARIYDLLGLFELADVLVTTDTAALHLSTACPKLGVIAFTNDNPFLATRPRLKPLFSCGYALALGSAQRVNESIFAALQSARERRLEETLSSASSVAS